MTILQINKFYYPRRGAEMVMLETIKLLEAHGHAVVPFAMRHPENLPTPYASSFVGQVETEGVHLGWQGLRTALRMLWSFEAQRKLTQLIKTTKPDIAHIHNIYGQLSPSILSVLRKYKIPVVMTVHDYALLGPKHIPFDHGALCTRGEKNPWEIVGHRCIKNSLVASLWAAFVFWMHKKLRLYEQGVDHYIVPSLYLYKRLIAAGFSESKISYVPHFMDASHVSRSEMGDYVACVAPLSPEKGIDVLLDAARRLSQIPMKIAGDGPEFNRLRERVERERLRNVEFVGKLVGQARDRFYRNALFLVVPSLVPETFGLTVLEAYAAGKPVIASNIGALPEVVRDGETGFLVESGDGEEFAEKIRQLFEDADLRHKMGNRAHELVEQDYTPARYYDALTKIYYALAHTSPVK